MTRLAFLRMMGMLPATRYGSMGQMHRRPDQQTDAPPSAVAPTQAAGILRARTVILFGTGQGVGLFEYTGTPAFGNPPVAWAAPPSVTKDPFGNVLIATGGGFISASATSEFAQLTAAALLFGSANASTRITADASVTLLEATSDGATPGITITAAGTTAGPRAQINVTGQSKNLAVPAQIIMGVPAAVPITTVLLEVQGSFSVGPAASNIEIWLVPSGDTTGAKDKTAINSALSSFEAVHLLPGTYFINAPLTPPTGVTLAGPAHGLGIPGDSYGISGLNLTGAIIKPVAAFSGSAAILMDNSAHVSQAGNVAICGISIDGTSLPAGTVHGIQSIGSVAEVWVEDVTVYKMTGNGLFANIDASSHPGDAWYILRSKFSNCGGYGVEMIGCGDSTIVATECANNTGGGNWHFRNLVNTRLIGCKAEWASAGPGYFVDWPPGGGGYMLFSGCTSEHNHSDGIFLGSIFNGGNLGTVVISGYRSQADGRNAGAGGGNFAGIQCHGFPGRLMVDGAAVITGIGLVGDAVSPQFGAAQIQGSYFACYTGCFLSGTGAATTDDATNTHALQNNSPVPF